MASQRRVSMGALLVAALAAAACGGKDRSAESPRKGGTAVVAISTEVEYLNSLVAGDKWTQELNRFALYMPLMRLGPKLDYQPQLAQSWEQQGDTAVVFHLRRDVRWTDGQPTTAADVLFTYQRATDPETAYPQSEYFTYYRGAEQLDPYTIRFRFRPHADPLAGFPFFPVMPRHLLDSIPPARLRNAAFNQHPVGNGPFKVLEHRANDHWTFVPNPLYPKDLGTPLLDRLVIRIVPEPQAQQTALLSGEVDMATSAGAKAFKDAAGRADIRRIARETRGVNFVVWNGKRPALRDARVRRALTLAMDRQTILDALRGGMGQLAIGPITPAHWAYDSTLKPLPYAPDSARAILEGLGYRDRNGDGVREDPAGKPWEIGLKVPAANSFVRNAAEMVQAQFARVGVKVRIDATDGKVWLDDIVSPARRFDATFMNFDSDIRIVFRDQFHSSSLGTPHQFASYSNPVVDSIIDRAPLTDDRRIAKPLWQRFQRIMLEEQPWTFMYYAPELILTRSSLHDTDMDVRGALVNVGKWWKAAPESAARKN